MGDVSGKTLIDATNSVSQTPDSYKTVFHALVDKTKGEVLQFYGF
jgi:hypothetical protein